MIRVLFVEASSGGVVGGSLTGLYHQIHAMDRSKFACAMALYEPKSIEADLRAIEVPVYQVRRRRLRKEHALLKYEGYKKAKTARPIRDSLAMARQTLRLLTEEVPAALRLARVIREAKADVVHLGNGVRANFDGILACMLTRVPCVVHVKGFEKYSDRERWIAPKVDAIVSMTKAVDQHCRAAGIVAKVNEVIYDAIAADAYRPRRSAADVRAELGVGLAPTVGVVGNIQEWKGQHVLVEAFPQLRRAVPDARALIIGGVHSAGAAYADRLQARLHELDLSDVVTTTGFRTDIADVVNALDVVVHTSIRPEPFGRVILEGMLLGKPVVAAAAGGVPELIRNGETGFLVPPGDSAALAEALTALFKDPDLRQRLGERARTWAGEQFSPERHVEQLSALYTNLVRSH